MSSKKYVIVGNGFAGTTCAEHLRKNDPAASITLFTDEAYPLYNRIALPPLLRKQVTEQKVIIRNLEWHEKHNIDLRLSTRVEQVVAEERRVVADGKSFEYDALLIATGGRPNPPAEPGGKGAHNLFNFQFMDDTKAISEYLETAKSAVAIGGSFIAYELAEAFTSRGMETHWLVRGPRFLRRMIGDEAAEMLHEAAREDGVHLYFNEEVKEYVRSNGVISKVITKSGLEIAADCFAVGLGLTMNTDLAQGAGAEIAAGGIRCDDRLETCVKGIFAAGDVADFDDPIAELHYRMGTWNNAGAHGKVVAANMGGGDVRYHDIPEYSSKIFNGQTITQFGLSPEYRPDLDMVHHVDHTKKWYRSLYFHEERLVGGILIGKGNRAGKRRYLDAIKAKERFPKTAWEAMLAWHAD
jgi:NAD(P)H-nitrite reductase large subunit